MLATILLILGLIANFFSASIWIFNIYIHTSNYWIGFFFIPLNFYLVYNLAVNGEFEWKLK